MAKYIRNQLPQLFYERPADTRIRMTKDEADKLIKHYSGWVIIGEVIWYLRTRLMEDGQTELRLVQGGGLD